MPIVVDFYTEVVYITSPTTLVTTQQLLDAIRAAEDTPEGMSFGGAVGDAQDAIGDATGKNNLGGGYFGAIDLRLHANWYIEFWSGVSLGQTAGGNILGGLDSRPVRAAVASGDTAYQLGAQFGTVVETGVSGLTEDEAAQLDELHKLQGLDASNPMTVTPTTRVAGSIDQTISGDGETTTTVTRN